MEAASSVQFLFFAWHTCRNLGYGQFWISTGKLNLCSQKSTSLWYFLSPFTGLGQTYLFSIQSLQSSADRERLHWMIGSLYCVQSFKTPVQFSQNTCHFPLTPAHSILPFWGKKIILCRSLYDVEKKQQQIILLNWIDEEHQRIVNKSHWLYDRVPTHPFNPVMGIEAPSLVATSQQRLKEARRSHHMDVLIQ